MRGTYTTLFSGQGNDRTEHLIFKPKTFDIATNIILTTDKRTYYSRLGSKKDADVKRIKFWYPQEFENRWKESLTKESNKTEKTESDIIAKIPDININTMNFDYEMSGDDPV